MSQDIETEQSDFVAEIYKHKEIKPLLEGVFSKMDFHNEWDLKWFIDDVMNQIIGNKDYEALLDEITAEIGDIK